MSCTPADNLLAILDAKIFAEQEDGRRKHLGASLIGRDCMRELWYAFRWAFLKSHEARMVRLFTRGHIEEARFVEYLQKIGVRVLDRDPETGDQWRISDVDGHFGGSLDGIAYGLPEIEISPGVFLCADDPVLLEFKTHGQKSFDTLVKDGLQKAKPEHFAQMQTYMLKRGIKIGLYMAVNKNTDELKLIWVQLVPTIGTAMLGKARDVIVSPSPPPRISNNPSWFRCRFCDFRPVCHLGERKLKGCRTCSFSKPVEGGEWYCARWQAVIPLEAQKEGCAHYNEIEE